MEAIGFLELNSIAIGINAADAMLKAAEIRLLAAQPGCPGKYYILICGEVAAVQSSIDVGESAGRANVVDSLVLARVHPQVIAAINMSCPPILEGAVGIMEFFSVTASIQAADAAVKSADVALLELRLGTGIGGKSFAVFTGDVAAVSEGVERGADTARESGMLVATTVIPRPHPDLWKSLC